MAHITVILMFSLTSKLVLVDSVAVPHCLLSNG
nr:MAG TPA: hypothetical protein [Caudoviricetes sp.]